MIYGNFEKNVYVFYPKNDNESNFLLTKGYKRGVNNEFFKIVAVNEVKNINLYEAPDTAKRYYEDEFIKAIADNKDLFFYTIAKDGRLLKVVGGMSNIEIFKQSISLAYSNELDKIFNQSYLNISLNDSLDKKYMQNKERIDNFTANNIDLKFELNTISNSHNYNNELKNESMLSLSNDVLINDMFKLLINDINNKNEIIKELISKLSTNPAIQGAPILLPTDLTELTQKLNNAFILDKNIIEIIINKNLKGYYDAKQ